MRLLKSVEDLDAAMRASTSEEQTLSLRGARYRNNKRIQVLEALMKELILRRRFEEQALLQQKGIERRKRNITTCKGRDAYMVQALKQYVTKEQLISAGIEADRLYAMEAAACAITDGATPAA